MKTARAYVDAFMPWAGLVVGLIAVGLVHQFGSEGMFNDCRAVGSGPLFVVAALGLLACAASAWLSWRSTRGSSVEAHRLVATISVGSALLFIFSILLALVAALILPPCFQ